MGVQIKELLDMGCLFRSLCITCNTVRVCKPLSQFKSKSSYFCAIISVNARTRMSLGFKSTRNLPLHNINEYHSLALSYGSVSRWAHNSSPDRLVLTAVEILNEPAAQIQDRWWSRNFSARLTSALEDLRGPSGTLYRVYELFWPVLGILSHILSSTCVAEWDCNLSDFLSSSYI
jgi:hypothetical protein